MRGTILDPPTFLVPIPGIDLPTETDESQHEDEHAPRISLGLRIESWFYLNIGRPWRIHSAPYFLVLRCPRPISTAKMLLWPRPWKYSVPPPLSVQYLLDHPETIDNRLETEINYIAMRWIKRFCERDTPLRSLYRLYETVVTAHEDEMMIESQYWFHQQTDWRIADIPDPKDPDPVRYAILASLVEALEESFNHKIKLGLRRGITNNKPLMILEFRNDPNPPLESAPTWCSEVGPLSQRLELVPGVGKVVPDDLKIVPGLVIPDARGVFMKRNIGANIVQLLGDFP